MSEQRINAALEEATDTRDVNEGTPSPPSPRSSERIPGQGPIVIVADGNTSRWPAKRSSESSKTPGTP